MESLQSHGLFYSLQREVYVFHENDTMTLSTEQKRWLRVKDIEKENAWLDEWLESLSEEKLKGKAMSAIVCIAAFALFAACLAVKGVLWILK